MIRILVLALLAVATMAITKQAAQAAEPPWCLISSSGEEHCRYNSLDACLPDRVGSGGFCNPNPRYRSREQPRQNHPARRY
jgi:Protein of unknown function (DUF3551)